MYVNIQNHVHISRDLVANRTEGDRFNDIGIYKKLLRTMEIIAMNGSAAIYEGGQIGQNLIDEIPGAITFDDLANYKVKEYKPNTTRIGSHEIMASPAPSSGPELLAFLNTLEYLNGTSSDFGNVTSEYLHNITNVLENLEKLQLQLGDTDEVNPNPEIDKKVQYMLSKNNSPKWVSNLRGKSLSSDPNYALSEPVAANVGVMDKKDNYVSVVTSLNTWFGSKVSTLCTYVTLKKYPSRPDGPMAVPA